MQAFVAVAISLSGVLESLYEALFSCEYFQRRVASASGRAAKVNAAYRKLEVKFVTLEIY